MKRYGKALLLIGLALLGMWSLYDMSQQDLTKVRSRFNSVDSQIRSLMAEREGYTQEISRFSHNIRESSKFLNSWYDHNLATKDFYEDLITQTAEKAGCVVVERNWDENEVNIGKLDYEVQEFKGKIVGDYRRIVQFVGELESTLQLSLVKELEFKVGVSGVTCSIVVYLPKLNFEGVVL